MLNFTKAGIVYELRDTFAWHNNNDESRELLRVLAD